MEYNLDDYSENSDDESIEDNFVFVDEVEIVKDFESVDSVSSILGLLSKKNNIKKNMAWWSNKASKIADMLENDTKPIMKQTNTIIPMSLIQTKYPEKDFSMSDGEFWTLFSNCTKKNTDGTYIYSKDELWKPYTTLETIDDDTKPLLSDTDAASDGRKSMFRIHQGEYVNISGYVSVPSVPSVPSVRNEPSLVPDSETSSLASNIININVDDYEEQLKSLKVGDVVFMYQTKRGKIEIIRDGMLSIREDDTNDLIEFDMTDWTNNSFFLYSRQFEPKVTKKTIFKKTIKAIGNRSKEFLTLSLQDMLLHSKNELVDYPSFIYNHEIPNDVLKEVYVRIDPHYNSKETPPICTRLNTDINTIQYYRTKLTNIKKLDNVFALKLLAKRKESLMIYNKVAVDDDDDNAQKNNDTKTKLHFVWDIQSAQPNKQNVIIVPMYMFKEPKQSNVEEKNRKSLTSFPTFFHLIHVPEKSGGTSEWEIGTEYIPNDSPSVAVSEINQIYFDTLGDLILNLRDNTTHYEYKSTFKYEEKSREGLEIHGLLDPEDDDDLGEQGIFFENAQVDEDDDPDFDIGKKTLDLSDQLCLELVKEDMLSHIDIQRIKYLMNTHPTKGKEHAIVYIVIAAQMYYPKHILKMNDTHLMSFPGESTFQKQIELFLSNHAIFQKVKFQSLPLEYATMVRAIPWLTRAVNVSKEAFMKNKLNSDKYGMWFQIDDKVKAEITETKRKIKINLQGTKPNATFQNTAPITSDQSLRNDSKPQNIEAFLNILLETPQFVNNEDLFLLKGDLSVTNFHKITRTIDTRLTEIIGDNNDHVLAKIVALFIQSDLKTTLGKIKNRYFLKTDELNKLNFDDAAFRNIIIEFFGNDTIGKLCENALNCIPSQNYYVENLDKPIQLLYLQLYLIHCTIESLPSSLQDFIISRLSTKISNNTLTLEDIRLKYEKSREHNKKRYMHAYEGMTDESRKLTKKLADLGLIKKDDILNEHQETENNLMEDIYFNVFDDNEGEGEGEEGEGEDDYENDNDGND